MKKFLVLMLVLGMAAMANATLTLVVSSDDPLLPSEEVTISVYNDTEGGPDVGTQQFFGFLAIMDYEAGEWLSAEAIVPPAVDGSTVALYGVVPYNIDGDLADLVELNLTNPSVVYTGIGDIASAIFHCTLKDVDVEVQLWDSNMALVDSIIIKQIPEPMTLALLGLGGLFLRRRK